MNKTQPYFSIIIPVFNTESYIIECFNSIIKQDFNDYECIFVNDGSTDSSLSILKKLEKTHKQVRVISQQNQGVSSARNTGINAAKGKFIMFMDSDDWLSPGTMSILHDVTSKYNGDLFEYGITYHKEKDTVVTYPKNSSQTDKISVHSLNFFSCINISHSPCDKLYLLKLINEHNIRFPLGVKIGEDLRFNSEYLLHCKNIVSIHESMYNYREGVGVTSLCRLSFNELLLSLNAIVSLFPAYEKKGKIFKSILFYKHYVHRAYLQQYTRSLPREFRDELFASSVPIITLLRKTKLRFSILAFMDYHPKFSFIRFIRYRFQKMANLFKC